MKDCCKELSNRYRRVNDPEERPGLVISRCRVCECRHFELTLDPGSYDMKGKEIGG